MIDERDFKRVAGKINDVVKEVPKDYPKALEEGAKILVQEAKRRAPRRTGRLRNNIMDKPLDSGRGWARHLVYVKAGKGGAWYGPAVEYGPNKRPFMRPALDSKRNQIGDKITAESRKSVRDIWDRQGRLIR